MNCVLTSNVSKWYVTVLAVSSNSSTQCMNEFDETAGTVKWTKRAASELEKLNKDCNTTAGLEAELKLAVGARVMLRHNLDTAQGLVNRTLGTVAAITKEYIQVTFDHTPNLQFKIDRICSKFQILRWFYVHRKQFSLIQHLL